jgi:probable HAF family extracellular repeat protein
MRHRVVFAFSLIIFCFISAFSVAQYTVTDLGTFSPVAINTFGQVAGNSNGTAAIWTGVQGVKSLGLLSGGSASVAVGINDLGAVAGVADGPGTVTFADSTTFPCTDLVQPFLWTKSSGMRGLGAPGITQLESFESFLSPCDTIYSVSGINIFGQVVGSNDDTATYKFGFLWSNSKWTQFTDAYQTTANGINDADYVVGQTGPATLSEISHAALFTNGTETDLGSLGGNASDFFYCSGAYSVNDLNEVVGWSTYGAASSDCFVFDLTSVHAFLWKKNTGMQDLGTLPGDTSSVAIKANLFGQVIGSSGSTIVYTNVDQDAVQVTGRPFLWNAHGGMQDLNTLIPANSGWTLNSVADINLWGQIVGLGTKNGQTHGFLLTPRIPNGF